MTALSGAWEEFRLLPFPDSGYTLRIGDADAMAYDSHMSGWVSRVAGEGTPLSEDEVMGLRANRDELADALPAMPDDARRYFEHLIRIADLALDQHSHRT